VLVPTLNLMPREGNLITTEDWFERVIVLFLVELKYPRADEQLLVEIQKSYAIG